MPFSDNSLGVPYPSNSHRKIPALLMPRYYPREVFGYVQAFL
jgi:hypothetical protein